MAGYTRTDTANNIADGKVIEANLFDAEYNAVEGAFNATTGHKHDGTSGEGAPITKVGPAQDLIVSSTKVEAKTSATLDLGSSAVRFKDAYLSGALDVDGTLDVASNVEIGGNLTVTGAATINGNLTFGDSDEDSVAFGADINSSIIPNVDSTYDLGTATKEWRNLYIDGTANIDSLVADTADINAGTIDGTLIGGTNPSAVIATNIVATTVTSPTISATTFTGNLIGDTSGIHYGAVTGNVTGDVTGNTTGTHTGAVVGNADTATALQTARTISLAGGVSGSVSFNGTSDVSITAVVADDSHNHVTGNIDGLAEYIQDTVGNMVIGNTESGIAVTYDDLDGTLDFNVNDPVITLTGAVTGSATMTDLGNVSIATTATADPTLTLAGDLSGSATFTNLGNATLTAVVANDSHNHTFSTIDGLQTALDAKADDSTTISAGGGLTGGGDLTANRTISHADTSSQGSVNNSGSTYIQDITLDGYGHITAIGSASIPAPTTTQVGAATAGLGAGTVGSYILARDITWTSGTRGTASTIAGTNLRPTGFSRVDEDYTTNVNKVRVGTGSALSGTWRLMGYLSMLDGYGKYIYTGSMYLRIS